MTFDEYQKAALRTASMGLGFEIETCVRALGLCGEAAEFKGAIGPYGTPDAEVKEAGDVLWYTAALAASFELTGADLGLTGQLCDIPWAGRAADECAEGLQNTACILAEMVKKEIGHKKPADRRVVANLLGGLVRKLAAASIRSLDFVAATNVAKLQARYPGGFDMAIASAKADSTPAIAPATAGPVSVDGDGRQVEEAQALAEPETVGHYPAGGGEWKPGPV